MRAVTPDDTELARRATGGDREAFGLLFDRWLDRAFDVAWHILHNRDAAADASQEAFAAAWRQIGNLRQPESFGGWLLRISRNKALEHLRKQRRSSVVGSEEALVTMDPRQADDPSTPLDQQEHGDLVWAASAALGEEDASLLNLHLRYELGAPELAEELGVKPNAAHQRLFRLKKRLADAIGAWVLWRKGTPSCPDLRSDLERASASSFDGATAKAIVDHARGCQTCDTSRTLQLSPEALFAALPVVAAGPLLRAKMVAALDGQSVPVSHTEPGAASDPPHEPAEATETGQPTESTELSEPGEPSDSAQPPETDEVDEPPGDVDGVDETEELPELVEAGPHETSRARRRRAAVAVAVLVALILLGGLASLTLLANQAGDGTSGGDEVEAGATDTDAVTRRTTTSPGDKDGERDKTTTTDTASTTDGAPGSTTDPPPAADAAVTTAPKTNNPGSTSTTATDPDGDQAPPKIIRFTAIRGRTITLQCSARLEIEVTFTWVTTDATSATLGLVGGSAEPVEPSGSVQRCARPGSEWTLTASGPGGPSVVAVATAPSS